MRTLWDFGRFLELSSSEDSEIELRVFELLTSGLVREEEMERMKYARGHWRIWLDSEVNSRFWKRHADFVDRWSSRDGQEKVELNTDDIIGGLKEIMQWQRKFIE